MVNVVRFYYIICSLFVFLFLNLKFVVSEYELYCAPVGEDAVFDALELGDVVFVHLSVDSLVAKGRYHLISHVLEPENVGVRLKHLPIITETRQEWYMSVLS